MSFNLTFLRLLGTFKLNNSLFILRKVQLTATVNKLFRIHKSVHQSRKLNLGKLVCLVKEHSSIPSSLNLGVSYSKSDLTCTKVITERNFCSFGLFFQCLPYTKRSQQRATSRNCLTSSRDTKSEFKRME